MGGLNLGVRESFSGPRLSRPQEARIGSLLSVAQGQASQRVTRGRDTRLPSPSGICGRDPSSACF